MSVRTEWTRRWSRQRLRSVGPWLQHAIRGLEGQRHRALSRMLLRALDPGILPAQVRVHGMVR